MELPAAAVDCPVCFAAREAAHPHSSQSPQLQTEEQTPMDTDWDAHSLPYSRTAKLQIFLSYGHDRFQQLAFHLKHILQARGHSVWVDVEKLSAGIDWEEGIASALSSVKDAQEDGRVLLLMTPHALRRPDGYCLNEIARAASSRLSIFPVMVADSEPPPAISMLPFFDLRDCVPQDDTALRLDAHGDEWRLLMMQQLHTDVFRDKALRLCATLELFDSVAAYGVPAIAGLDNLGVFDTATTSRPIGRESRGHSVRRLLLARRSSSSLDISAPSSPLEKIQQPTIVRADAGAKETLDTTPDPTRYIFSFDSSCYVLAKQLYTDLSAMGFAMYDPPVPGAVEDRGITQAMQWASAEKNGKMILLVTPESVGRPHGECLNDISAAMAAGLGFVPLMVRPCEIPLSICRIQWLDLSDCLVYHSTGDMASACSSSGPTINLVRFEVRRDQLATALRGKLDHEGQQARLFALLAPFSFQLQISKLTMRFAGRDWLFSALRDWIDSSESSTSQVFWVAGPIGAGKTALAARMVQTIPEIAAFHFALQEDEQTQNARRCVLSLAYQLTTQLPAYAAWLHAGQPLEEIVPVSSFQALVSHLLVEPLNAIARPASSKPLLLLLDGLEHLADSSSSSMPPERPRLGHGGKPGSSSSAEEECLVTALPSLIARLPKWVRVVLLSREEHTIRTKLQLYTPTISLDHTDAENALDIRAFIENALQNSKSRLEISSAQIDCITKRAEGLFLYAVNIVQALEEGRLSVDQLQSLPMGMGGYLRQFFDSHFDAQAYKQHIRPVLEVLGAAYEPFTTATVASILQLNAYDQQELASSFGSLLYVAEDGSLRPFHSSVFDWVQDVETAGPYYVDVNNGHERIGRWCAREYDAVVQSTSNEFVNLNYELESTASDEKTRMHIYIVRHACNHLMQAQALDCMQLVSKFASDDKFQLARRLSSLRAEGLESFFHGDIDRERAQELLVQSPQSGSFLIRYSARQQSYCATFIDKVDAVSGRVTFKHNLIYHLSTGAYSVVPPKEVTAGTLVFPDLVSFVEEYQRKGILRSAISRTTALNREISITPNA